MLNIENVRRIFELRRACLLQRRKDGEYSDRHARADWSLFQEAFTAGYQYAQEEQDSNLTCDHCCNELGMDDGSIRLCGECKSKQSKWISVKEGKPNHEETVLLYVNGKITEAMYWCHFDETHAIERWYLEHDTILVKANQYWQPQPEPPKEEGN